MTKSLADLTPAEVMGLAIDVERNNSVRFATVRDFFASQDHDVYEMFDELHKEEQEHLAILEKAAQELFPDGVPQVLEGDVVEVIECVDVDDGEHALFDEISREDAIRMALHAELKAQELYRRAANSADDPELKKLYEFLCSLEGDHEQRLQTLLDETELEEK